MGSALDGVYVVTFRGTSCTDNAELCDIKRSVTRSSILCPRHVCSRKL